MKTRTKERENFIMSVNYKKILNLQMKQTGPFSVVAVRVFLKDVEVHRLGRYTLPSTVNDINREMFFTVSEQLYLMTLKKLFRNFYFYFYFHLSHTIALLSGTARVLHQTTIMLSNKTVISYCTLKISSNFCMQQTK